MNIQPLIRLADIMANEISGVVSCWKIHIFPRTELLVEGIDVSPQDFPAVMTALVVDDFKGRFQKGTAMRSSRLTGFDLQNMTVHTLYSEYQLKGLGFIEVGIPGRYDFEVGATMMQIAHIQNELELERGEQ